MKHTRSVLPAVIAVFVCWSLLIQGCGKPEPPKEIPITTKSDEARQLFLQARDLTDIFKTTEAAKLLDQAIQKDPEFAAAYLARANAGGGFAIYRENLDKAKALANKVSKGEQLRILFEAAAAGGNTRQQGIYLDSLLALYPSDKRVTFLAGQYHDGLGDTKKAVEYYKQIARMDSTFAPAYNYMGYAYVQLEDFAAAEKAFKTYTQLKPDAADSYDSYAEFLMKRGRFDESIAEYKKGMEKDPSYRGSLVGIGNNYVLKGDFENARKSYQKYIDGASVFTEKATGLYFIAVSYVHEGKIPEAVKALEERRLIQAKENSVPGEIGSITTQGLILTEFGKPPEALKKYMEAVELAKTGNLPEGARETQMVTANVYLAWAYAECNMLPKAMEHVELYRKDVERRANPNEKMNLDWITAYLAVKRGEYDKGLELWAKLPPGPDVFYYQALAYKGKGDKANVKAMVDKIANWNSNSIWLAIMQRMVRTGKLK